MPKPSPKIKRNNSKLQKQLNKAKKITDALGSQQPPTQSTQQQIPVVRKPSYEAAVSTQSQTEERLQKCTSISKDNVDRVKPKSEWNLLNHSEKHNMRGKDIATVNSNNNNCNVRSPPPNSKPEFSGIWRIDNSSPDSKANKRRSSGCEVYREISSQLSKLALVSPISDVWQCIGWNLSKCWKICWKIDLNSYRSLHGKLDHSSGHSLLGIFTKKPEWRATQGHLGVP